MGEMDSANEKEHKKKVKILTKKGKIELNGNNEQLVSDDVKMQILYNANIVQSLSQLVEI